MTLAFPRRSRTVLWLGRGRDYLQDCASVRIARLCCRTCRLTPGSQDVFVGDISSHARVRGRRPNGGRINAELESTFHDVSETVTPHEHMSGFGSCSCQVKPWSIESQGAMPMLKISRARVELLPSARAADRMSAPPASAGLSRRP
jgi:hypothetical protein